MSDTIKRDHRFTVTPEHLTLDPRVSDRAHRLWCRLDRMAGPRDRQQSAREELSIEMDCSLASIDRALGELTAAGWLKVQRHRGGASTYTLVVAPEKAVVKLADKAREERRARWEGKRRAYEAASTAKRRDVQVSDGGVVMGDDTSHSAEGVVMGDDRVSSPATTGVVMGDDHMEEGRTQERNLFSVDADAPTTPEDQRSASTTPPPAPEDADRLSIGRADVEDLCAHLADFVERTSEPHRRPRITKKWRRDARLLLDGGVDLVKAERLIDWIATDLFWSSNCLSMPTFRDKYEQIRRKAVADWERRKAQEEPARPLFPQPPRPGSGAWGRRVVLPGPDETGAA